MFYRFTSLSYPYPAPAGSIDTTTPIQPTGSGLLSTMAFQDHTCHPATIPTNIRQISSPPSGTAHLSILPNFDGYRSFYGYFLYSSIFHFASARILSCARFIGTRKDSCANKWLFLYLVVLHRLS